MNATCPSISDPTDVVIAGAVQQRRRCAGQAFLHLLAVLVFPFIAMAGDGFEVRGGSEIAAHLTEHWKGVLQAETRFNEHGDQSRYHSDIGVIHTGMARWIDVGLRYRTIFKRTEASNQESDWTRLNRYYLDLVARHRICDLPFSHRLRMEYDAWEDDFADYGTLRYRIGLNAPYELRTGKERRILKDYKRRFYGNYELSAASDKEAIVRHQFKLGWSATMSEALMWDVYYLYEWNNSSVDIEDLNVVGLAFKVLL